MLREISAEAGPRFEATCERTVLRGCRSCGAPHPMVSHKVNVATCPKCGAPVAQLEHYADDTVVAGLQVPLRARLLLAVARWLTRLSKGL